MCWALAPAKCNWPQERFFRSLFKPCRKAQQNLGLLAPEVKKFLPSTHDFYGLQLHGHISASELPAASSRGRKAIRCRGPYAEWRHFFATTSISLTKVLPHASSDSVGTASKSK